MPGPPQSVSSLRQMRWATSSSAACFTRSAIARLELVGDHRLDRGRPPRDDGLALATRCPASSFSIGIEERLDAVAQQLVGHVVHVDAGVGQLLELVGAGRCRPLRPSTSPCSATASSVGIGIVFTVSGPDQPVHVHRLRVVRVLDAGGGPERALHRRARVAQLREALAVEDLLERAGTRRARSRARRCPGARCCPAPRAACPPRCRRARRRSSRPSARRAARPPRGGARGPG